MSEAVRPQRRSRRIAMSAEERASFLAQERTCRVASVGADGPHATPLWFVWDEPYLWLYSIIRSQRWADLMRDPRIGVVVDAGVAYTELRGIEISGTVDVVGEVPRTGEQNVALEAVEAAFVAKYHDGTAALQHDRRHAWLRVTPDKIVSWDFRKM